MWMQLIWSPSPGSGLPLTDNQVRNKIQNYALTLVQWETTALFLGTDSTVCITNSTNSAPWTLSLEWLTVLFWKTQYSYYSCLIISRMDFRWYLLCVTSFWFGNWGKCIICLYHSYKKSWEGRSDIFYLSKKRQVLSSWEGARTSTHRNIPGN